MKEAALALALVLSFAATSAVGQTRPSTLQMSCAQARGLVAGRGAVVLGTGGFTYDRFVRDRGFCQITEGAEPAWVPSADAPQCLVGYRCKEREPQCSDC